MAGYGHGLEFRYEVTTIDAAGHRTDEETYAAWVIWDCADHRPATAERYQTFQEAMAAKRQLIAPYR